MAGVGDWRPEKPKLDRIAALIRTATASSAEHGEQAKVAAVSRLRELSETTADVGLYALVVLRAPPAPSADNADQIACSMVQAAVRRAVRDRAAVHPEFIRRAKEICAQECIGSPTRPHGPRAQQSLAATVALLARHFGVHAWPEVIAACRRGLRPSSPAPLRQLSAALASMLLEDVSAAATGQQPGYGAAGSAGRKSRWGPPADSAGPPDPAQGLPALDLGASLGAMAPEGFGPASTPAPPAAPGAGGGFAAAVARGRLAVDSLAPVAVDLTRWATAGCQALHSKRAGGTAGSAARLPEGVSADEAIQMLPVALEAIEKCPHAVGASPEMQEAVRGLIGGLSICLTAAASAANSGFLVAGPRSSQGNQVLAAGVHAAGVLRETLRDHAKAVWGEVGGVWDGVVAAMRQTKCRRLQRAVVEVWLEAWSVAKTGLDTPEVRRQMEGVAARVAPLLVPMCLLQEEDEMGGNLPVTDISDASVPDSLAELHPAWKHKLEGAAEGGAGGGVGPLGSDSMFQDIDDGISIDAAAACGASSDSGGLMWTLRRSAALGLEAACYAGQKAAISPVLPIIASGAGQEGDWRRREASTLCAGILAPPLGKAQGFSPAVEGLLKRMLHLLKHDAQPLVRRGAAWTIARVATSTLEVAASDARFEAHGVAVEREHAIALGGGVAPAASAAPGETPRQIKIRQAIDACFRSLIQAMNDRNKLVQRGVLASLEACLQQVSNESTESVLVPSLISAVSKGLGAYQLRSYLAVCRLGSRFSIIYGQDPAVRDLGRSWLPVLLRRWGMLCRASAAVAAAVPLRSAALRTAYGSVLGGEKAGAGQPVPGPQQVARYAILSMMAGVVQVSGDSAGPAAPQLSSLACLVAHDELSRYARLVEDARRSGAERPSFGAEEYAVSALRLLSACAAAAKKPGVAGGGGAFLPVIDQPDVFGLLPVGLGHASAAVRTAAFRLASNLVSACPARTLSSAKGITLALVESLKSTAGTSAIAMATSAVAMACKLLRVAQREDRTLAENIAGQLAPPLIGNVRAGGLLQSQPILLQAQSEAIAWCCVCAPARTASQMRPELLGLVALYGVGVQQLSISPSDTPQSRLREVTARGCMAAITANPALLQPQVGPSLATLVYMCHQAVPSADRPGSMDPPSKDASETANAILGRLKAAAGGQEGLGRLLGRMPPDQRDFLLRLAGGM